MYPMLRYTAHIHSPDRALAGRSFRASLIQLRTPQERQVLRRSEYVVSDEQRKTDAIARAQLEIADFIDPPRTADAIVEYPVTGRAKREREITDDAAAFEVPVRPNRGPAARESQHRWARRIPVDSIGARQRRQQQDCERQKSRRHEMPRPRSRVWASKTANSASHRPVGTVLGFRRSVQPQRRRVAKLDRERFKKSANHAKKLGNYSGRTAQRSAFDWLQKGLSFCYAPAFALRRRMRHAR
jgi:hypothetical protein